MCRCWISEWRFCELASVPELEPLEVVRSVLDIIVVTMVLEEKLLVAPERWRGLGASHKPTDEAFRALVITVLGRAIVAKDFEHSSVFGHNLELLLEVVLEMISPAIDIVRLYVYLEGPVRVLLLVSKLIVLGKLHNGHGTGMIGDLGQVLAYRLSSTVIIHLFQDIGPTVLKEVE